MLSKTYEQSILAARQAMELYPGCKVITIDSKTASLGQGCLAVKAAQAKQNGKTLEETATYIEETIKKSHLWVMADDLHHLKRGGRISGAKAIVGTMLNVKPILTIGNNGRLAPVDKTRGRNKALAFLLDCMEKYQFIENETIYIPHSDDIELAKQLEQMIINKYGKKEIIINEIGPVVGAHTGPGTVAVMFIGNGERVNFEGES